MTKENIFLYNVSNNPIDTIASCKHNFKKYLHSSVK